MVSFVHSLLTYLESNKGIIKYNDFVLLFIIVTYEHTRKIDEFTGSIKYNSTLDFSDIY